VQVEGETRYLLSDAYDNLCVSFYICNFTFQDFNVLSSLIHVSAACARNSRNRNSNEGFFVILKFCPSGGGLHCNYGFVW
jgi:hypothetical protein